MLNSPARQPHRDREHVTQIGIETFGASTSGGPGYGELIAQLRKLIDAATMTGAPDSEIEAATGHIAAATRSLSRRVAESALFPAGHRFDLPGRGHPMLVPLHIDALSADTMLGHLRFTSAHMGHAGIAHGGFVALVFDELFGVFPSRLDPPARTAAIAINYRAGSPVDVDLQVEAHLLGIEGRKVRAQGVLRHGDKITAEGQALFVQPRQSI
jgi:acyl-coenzyme A thioesterase PaaI-like protein